MNEPKPLVVDLDGTLVRTDTLIESLVALVCANPLNLFRFLAWLLQGKAFMKARVAAQVKLAVELLPYEQRLLERLKTEREQGRLLVLATASHRQTAEPIAEHLGLFDRVFATDGTTNLKREAKGDALVEAYGRGGFDYAGNSTDDLPVWQAADTALLVNPDPGVEKAVQEQGLRSETVCRRKSRWSTLLTAMRPHQWIKNALVLVPLLASHRFGEDGMLLASLIAMASFSLCASGVYLLNDLLDLDDDRRHPRKCRRPLASGALDGKTAVLASAASLFVAFALALLFLSPGFAAVLLGYFALTLAYGLWFRRLMLVDVVVLALLYTLRIVAGAAAIGSVLTFWLLAFSLLIFFSLALLKRYVELKFAVTRGEMDR